MYALILNIITVYGHKIAKVDLKFNTAISINVKVGESIKQLICIVVVQLFATL